MSFKVTFRTDASLLIGTGHVMRCLTLADALRARGADCRFLCRAHVGNLNDFIYSKGYPVHVLPAETLSNEAKQSPSQNTTSTAEPAHSHWLGGTQKEDANACATIMAHQRDDWLIVDHYALDIRWERALAPYCSKLMVIDDLADRAHYCDLLLDQTLDRDAADYSKLVAAGCFLLCGSKYALLRPEFGALRPYSLQRRANPVLREVLITMGGVDRDNATGLVLQALRSCSVLKVCRITVVMGSTAPWLEEVRRQANKMPWPTKVLIGVTDMAHLMANSDLAIGAAGGTSWERCCLGLPTIMLLLALNQQKVAQGLEQSGAAMLTNLGQSGLQLTRLLLTLSHDTVKLQKMSECAARLTDGSGVGAVVHRMTLGATDLDTT